METSSTLKTIGLVAVVLSALAVGVWLGSDNKDIDPRLAKMSEERRLQVERQRLINLKTAQFNQEYKQTVQRLKDGACDTNAIIKVIANLSSNRENRKVSDITESYFSKCGVVEKILKNKLSADLAVNEYERAQRTALAIIERYPDTPSHWAWLSETREKLGNLDGAISAFRHSLSLFPEPKRVSVREYYRMSRLLEKQGRHCEAKEPLEQYVSYDVEARRKGQVKMLLEQLEKKGDCKNLLQSPDITRVTSLMDSGALVVKADINGKAATLIVDTGASYVYLNRDFAKRASLKINPQDTLVAITANGRTINYSSRIETIQLGQATANEVTCAIQGEDTPELEGIDGLLGLSFLSRFKFSVDGNQLVLEKQKI